MNILVIGNGFDLAHNLPTQYSEFLCFIKAIANPGNSCYSSFINEIKENRQVLFSEIQTLMSSNKLLDYFLSIYEERCKVGKDGWIDFEHEISIIVQKFDEAKQILLEKINGPTGEAIISNNELLLYLKPLIASEQTPLSELRRSKFRPSFFDEQARSYYDSLNHLIRLLEIYLFEYVGNLKIDFRLPELQKLTIDHVLIFNYTETYKKLYDPDTKAQYCYVHGKAQNCDEASCNLVLGIDEYLPPDRIDVDNQFVWCKKFYQRIYKQTGSEYIDWVNQQNRSIKGESFNVYIYGHSLDITDKDILSKLILTHNAKIYIYYHNRKAMANQINNLIKLIGEETLIKMTGGKNRSISFIQSQPALTLKEQENNE